jgi:redox-sensitive bicupin YhaK (pirin superfamily)
MSQALEVLTMITIRRRDERGKANFGWLDSRHTFSFGQYRDPAHMGFRSLRVINEDRVIPGQGFATHSHADMEIISYVLAGRLEHKDSLGTGAVIQPGEVQRMTAGTGITHSEFNPSSTEAVHFLQIWILPEARGLQPSYEQKSFPSAEKQGVLRLVASRDGRNGSVTVHQDADLYVSHLSASDTVKHEMKPGRHGWLQVANGAVTLNDQAMLAGDGAAISNLSKIEIGADTGAEILLFDLA